MRASIKSLVFPAPGLVAASFAVLVSAAVTACGGASTTPASGPSGAGLVDSGVTATVDVDGGASTTMAPLEDGGIGQKLPNVGDTRAPEPGRTPDDILAMVKARRPQARACYDAALHDHPGIEGNITMKWTIDPQGNISDVGVDPSNTQILEPDVGSCLMGIIMGFKFPESPRGLQTFAKYPFNFHPRGSPAAGH